MSDPTSSPANPPQGDFVAAPKDAPTAAPIHAQAWALAEASWASGAVLPWLHQEVARRMADRLAVIRSQPEVVMEWGALAGQSRGVLQAAYPGALWVPVERAQPSLQRLQFNEHGGRKTDSLGRRLKRLLGRDSSSPAPTPGWLEGQVPPAHGQLLWSNLGLHTHDQPQEQLRSWHAALAVDGFLMFSAFGPDTVRELRSLWMESGWGHPAQPFRDMHDWGDDLVMAGFADPVMDQETITLTWADADAALAELRTLGRNAHPDRCPGCRTPRWAARMKAALHGLAGADGRIALTFEIVYGHAFKPLPRLRVEPVVSVELDQMRRMVQSARKGL